MRKRRLRTSLRRRGADRPWKRRNRRKVVLWKGGSEKERRKRGNSDWCLEKGSTDAGVLACIFGRWDLRNELKNTIWVQGRATWKLKISNQELKQNGDGEWIGDHFHIQSVIDIERSKFRNQETVGLFALMVLEKGISFAGERGSSEGSWTFRSRVWNLKESRIRMSGLEGESERVC